MKDEFLATLSHELRTPLSAIVGWSNLLLQGQPSEADIKQGLSTIERNARVQTQLIEDLLDMSRIISGKLRLDIQRVLPVAFIEAAINSVRPAADAKGNQAGENSGRAGGAGGGRSKQIAAGGVESFVECNQIYAARGESAGDSCPGGVTY